MAASDPVAEALPPPVRDVLRTLWGSGHAGYVVGGGLRDLFLDRQTDNWDFATDARPERTAELFDDARYENRFGTVVVRRDDTDLEITTFRSDHDYADFRRPHRVEWSDRVELDLARRDFTVNAMAWGAGRPGAPGEPTPEAPGLVDPWHGRADIEARLLRAVGDPVARFREDALRMLRAVRLATTLGYEIEPATLAAITSSAELASRLSGERIAAELDRILAAEHPSTGLRLLASSGLLAVVLPELATQRGIPQNKIEGEDLWDHTVRSVDAAPRTDPIVRLAALLPDIGKPATAADGHFPGHERVGEIEAAALLTRLHYPRAVVDRVARLVRHHMFDLDAEASDAAVRRFIGRVGRELLPELWALRAADSVGSGRAPNAGGLDDVRRRVEEQLAADVALDIGDLAIDGNDLIAELGLRPSPTIGRVLNGLLERVVDEPTLNDRPTLLLIARTMLDDDA